MCDDTSCGKSCDLFSGLKKLVKGIQTVSDCNACDGVVACNPCDDASDVDPCGEVGCNDSCLPKFELGKRLRNFLATKHCSTDECNPCDVADDCGPCDDTGCGSCLPKISLRDFFKGFRIARCNSECNPCDEAGDCDPCGDADACGNSCVRGHIIDLPRLQLKKLFDGILVGKCNSDCNPCDQVECNPCDDTCVR
ncbi:MAG: hypothetical protein LBT89_03460 [Planctomycetaceae bacterium]|nr:hypothetical protein [Planctomycetaceae bacterium]